MSGVGKAVERLWLLREGANNLKLVVGSGDSQLTSSFLKNNIIPKLCDARSEIVEVCSVGGVGGKDLLIIRF